MEVALIQYNGRGAKRRDLLAVCNRDSRKIAEMEAMERVLQARFQLPQASQLARSSAPSTAVLVARNNDKFGAVCCSGATILPPSQFLSRSSTFRSRDSELCSPSSSYSPRRGGRRGRGVLVVCMAKERRVKTVSQQIKRRISEMLLYDKVVQAAVLPETALGADMYLTADATISDVEMSKDLPGHLSPQRTLYLVDVYPLCYEGKKPRPRAILNWMELLFNEVSLAEPIIAVMDGERGNEYRKQLLPSYKENRNKFKPLSGIRGPYFKGDQMDLRDAYPHIKSFLTECNVPVLKYEDAEADDVIATLAQQASNRGMKVVVASPDMDYRQLLSHSVKMALPLPEFGRWSFYTRQQYLAEHDCEPSIDLGLRCMLGDQSDNIPGLQEWSTGFGRKTALKLMKKHGSLEKLLLASEIRTVGKPYIQDALAKYRHALYRNLQVLSLRRDLDIPLKDEWLTPRDRSNEAQAFQQLRYNLQDRSYPR